MCLKTAQQACSRICASDFEVGFLGGATSLYACIYVDSSRMSQVSPNGSSTYIQSEPTSLLAWICLPFRPSCFPYSCCTNRMGRPRVFAGEAGKHFSQICGGRQIAYEDPPRYAYFSVRYRPPLFWFGWGAGGLGARQQVQASAAVSVTCLLAMKLRIHSQGHGCSAVIGWLLRWFLAGLLGSATSAATAVGTSYTEDLTLERLGKHHVAARFVFRSHWVPEARHRCQDHEDWHDGGKTESGLGSTGVEEGKLCHFEAVFPRAVGVLLDRFKARLCFS